MKESDLVTALEACAILSTDWPTNITLNNLRQLTFRGRITPILTAGGKKYYNRHEVEAYALHRPRSASGNVILGRVSNRKN